MNENLGDRWVPNTKKGQIEPNRSQQTNVHQASQLMKEGKWNKEIIGKCFNKQVTDDVFSIPISYYKRNDRWFQKFSKTAEYTVKSGYVVARELASRSNTADQDGAQTSYQGRKESV